MTAHATSASEAELPPLTDGPHRKRIGLISVVACLGGLLFGYDVGVANGAEGPMAKELGLSLLQLGVVISSLVFAAAIGALAGGVLADAIGRRKTILLLAVLFFVGVVLVVFAPAGPELGTYSPMGFAMLVAGRIILGLAVGSCSTVVPVYLAEFAPYEIRGSISGRNELAIVIGNLAAFSLNAVIGNVFAHVDGVWRIMFSVCALPAVALFIGMLRMPESPRWLVEKGRHDEALAVLKTVRSEERAIAELGQVELVAEEELQEAQVGLKAILANKWLVRIVLVGIGVSVAQRLTGINSIMFYGARVLEESGMSYVQALIANVVFGVTTVVGGIIALRNMDRIDRRKTFLLGLAGTTICHALVVVASIALPAGNPARPYVIVVLVVAFLLSFETFLNIAVWVWLAEIFPLHMRGLGIGISVFFGWTIDGFLALFFPSLVSGIGITGAFLLYACIGVLSVLFVWTQVPETRGRSLEALEEDVAHGRIFAGIRS